MNENERDHYEGHLSVFLLAMKSRQWAKSAYDKIMGLIPKNDWYPSGDVVILFESDCANQRT